MMNRNHTRFSLPSKIIELLYSDDEFYRYALKHKKAKEVAFPKYNTYRDQSGFNMVFALAGYSSKDVSIEFFRDELIISSSGIKDADNSDDNAQQSVQRGYIVRGMARRKFTVNFQISNLFDITKAHAHMRDGALYITIPENSGSSGIIKINYESGED